MPYCAYCGGPLETAKSRCDSCGAHGGKPPEPAPSAGRPPPPAAPGVRPAGMSLSAAQVTLTQRAGTLLLWFLGGFVGLHCFFAGRPGRGLIYIGCIAGFIVGILLVPTGSPEADLRGGMLYGVFALSLSVALGALWLYDGVRILFGRFP